MQDMGALLSVGAVPVYVRLDRLLLYTWLKPDLKPEPSCGNEYLAWS
jgi:hypothetical protein